MNDLISLLHARRDVSAGELATLLGVSRATLARLLADAGDRICTMGRARATRYALTRSIQGLGTRLSVHEIDEEGSVRRYGTIHLLANSGHWVERANGQHELFEGLPPFVSDMAPQGYIGRSFPATYPELQLPLQIQHWNDEHKLLAIARRGEDCVGNLIIGDESFSRFLASTPSTVSRHQYPEYARRSLEEQPGSSAGGEHPKFAVLCDGRHVLVKFASAQDNGVAQRLRDLLACEHEALLMLLEIGIATPAATLLEIDGMRFLETERFDRVGERGRKGVLSLFAFACHHLGYVDNWTKASVRRQLLFPFSDNYKSPP